MTRTTSAEAFRWIRESKLLQPIHRKVCTALSRSVVSMTATEIAETIEPKARINTISPRLTELRRMGVLKERTPRPCYFTGRTVITWELTGKEPQKQAKPAKRPCPTCSGSGFTDEDQVPNGPGFAYVSQDAAGREVIEWGPEGS